MKALRKAASAFLILSSRVPLFLAAANASHVSALLAGLPEFPHRRAANYHQKCQCVA